MKSFAVIGNPIAHSKSPLIHQAFAEQTGMHLHYEKRLAPVDAFAKSLQQFFDNGGSGANVTLPFKQEAFSVCQQVTDRAEVAGAVNTLWQKDGNWYGDNTDGIGLVTDMTHNLGWTLSGKKLLVLGAGGAVRGILKPLADAGIQQITLANRTLSRAQSLASDMRQYHIAVTPVSLEAPQGDYDLVINAISAGLSGEMPPLPAGLLNDRTRCYDLVYGKERTPFLTYADSQGAKKTADGLGMLVEQAAASYQRWLGVIPDTAPVIQLLRDSH